ncbi:unnamed protein product [Mytilus coruscus]|uniref:Uncharacterized protein n=1 Tax=Mytilus coruscus TaxID=42192 RepID=A0A6J8ALL5_MYTCO|nr:unnamed protein product [Mytilus coruscus]
MKREREKTPVVGKKFWQYVKSKKRDSCGIAPLSSNGKLMEDSKGKAEALNHQFVSIFTDENTSSQTKLNGSPSPDIDHLQITVEGRQVPVVKIEEDHLTTGSQWEEWLEGIEREFRYFRITDPEDKKDAMIIYGGKDISRLEKSTPDPVDRRMDVYEKLKKKLNDYFAPKKNKHYANYLFLKVRPVNGESTVAYAARLRERAADCEFENQDDGF